MPGLTGWDHRKSHTITGSAAGAQTNYQVGIKVYYGSGTDGTEVVGGATFGKVYTGSKCKADFGDIRFTKADGISLLDYWIERQIDSDYAIIWVEVDSIPASPSTVDIFIYYGKADATTTSNGDDTFLIFNDCATTTGWSVQYIVGSPAWGTAIIDGVSTIYIEANAHNEKLRIQYDAITCTGRENRRSLTRVKHTSWNQDGYFYWYSPLLLESPSGYDALRYSSYFDDYTIYASVGGVTDTTDYGVGHPDGWYRYERKANAAGAVTAYRDAIDLGTATIDGDYSGGKVMYYVNEWNPGLTKHYIDWFAVGKYVDPEPTHTSWGPAETFQDLPAEFIVKQWQEDLHGKFDVGQDSIDFLARFEVGQGSTELLGKFEAQATAELLGKFEAQATAELLGKFDSQVSLNLPGEFIIRHVGIPVELPAEFFVKQWMENLPGKFIVQDIGSADLHAAFESQTSVDLLGEFIVRHSGPVPWLTGWHYRKTHMLTGSTAGAQTNYPVGVKVYYGTGADGTEVVNGVTFGKIYCDSKCNTDFSDIRFINWNGTTLLGYWLQEKIDSDYAIFWVEVDSIPASPHTTTIYIYYGNASATTISDGDAIFTFFDDFTRDRGWTIGNPTYIQILDDEDCLWIDYRRPASNLYCYRPVSGLTDGFELWIDSWYDITVGADDWVTGYFNLSENTDGSRHSESEIYGIRGWGQASANKHGLLYWNGVGLVGKQDGDVDPNSDRFIYRISKHDTRLEYYCSSGNVADGTEAVTAGIPAIAYMKAWITDTQAGTASDDCRKKIYVIRIRKWVYPEPAHTAWGPETEPSLFAEFEVGQDSADFLARFEVGQGSADLHGKFESQVTAELLGKAEIQQSASAELLGKFEAQGSAELLGKFEAQATAELSGKFDVGQSSVELLGKFEVGQDSAELLGNAVIRHVGIPVELLGKAVIRHVGTPAELLGKFEAQSTTELLGRFDVGQNSAELLAWFLIPRAYDFSSGMGISFDWWGSGGVDQQIDFEMWSLTGGWVGKFPDGPAEWRQVQISWDDLTPVDLDGTRPDSSQIIGIYWTYHTPGVRRIDGIRAWMRQDLLCKVVIKNANASDLLSRFEIQVSQDLLCKFETGTQGFNDLKAEFYVEMVILPGGLWDYQYVWQNLAAELEVGVQQGQIEVDPATGAITARQRHAINDRSIITMCGGYRAYSKGTFIFDAEASIYSGANPVYTPAFGLVENKYDWWAGGSAHAAMLYSDGVGGWDFYTEDDGDTESTGIAGIDFTTQHTFKIIWEDATEYPATGRVRLYIDDVLKATHETAVPTHPLLFFLLMDSYIVAYSEADVWTKLHSFTVTGDT